MIRKNYSVRFERPLSSMRRALVIVEQGPTSWREVAASTGLKEGQAKGALYNLAFIGAIVRVVDSRNRSVYVVPDRRPQVGASLRGVRSIFDVR